MIERGIYYPNEDFKKLINKIGGEWFDTKKRPMVCLIKAKEDERIYWAIPMGKYNHRTSKQINRLNFYLNLPSDDIRSCYYHIGKTTAKSIFFISDAVPIIDKYILEEHLGPDNKPFIIKNDLLIEELKRKLYRILSIENSCNNYFRQHITSIKLELMDELQKNN